MAEKQKILIIDDEQGIVEELQDFLEDEGYWIETALDGKRGMELLDSFKPRLVVTDLKLPDFSGIDILKKCRTHYPDIKVIVCTGYVDQVLIDEAEALERDAFIQKPFDLEFMKKEIEKLI